MRLLILILAVILICFQYQFWWGKNGYADLEKNQQEIKELKIKNKELQINNNIMFARIKDLKELKEGSDAIEEQAREEYNMIKSNEIFYRVIKEK